MTPGGYVSPYGKPRGVVDRLRAWCDRCRRDPASPWPGLGIIGDIEMVLRVLDNREWLESLRAGNDPEAATFAGELLGALDTIEATESAIATADRVIELPNGEYTDPPRAVEALAQEAHAARHDIGLVRDVLVKAGALADDDEETKLHDLLRALLT